MQPTPSPTVASSGTLPVTLLRRLRQQVNGSPFKSRNGGPGTGLVSAANVKIVCFFPWPAIRNLPSLDLLRSLVHPRHPEFRATQRLHPAATPLHLLVGSAPAAHSEAKVRLPSRPSSSFLSPSYLHLHRREPCTAAPQGFLTPTVLSSNVATGLSTRSTSSPPSKLGTILPRREAARPHPTGAAWEGGQDAD